MPHTTKQREPPKKKEFPNSFSIVAADLSLRRPGLARFDIEKNNNDFYYICTTYSLDNKKSKECRSKILCEIASWIKELTENIHQKTYFVREKAFNSRGSQSEIGIFEVVGITDMLIYASHNETWEEIYPITVKKTVTGNAKADKEHVARSVKQYLPKNKFANDDESDAAAVGIAYMIQNGILKTQTECDHFDDS